MVTMFDSQMIFLISLNYKNAVFLNYPILKNYKSTLKYIYF